MRRSWSAIGAAVLLCACSPERPGSAPEPADAAAAPQPAPASVQAPPAAPPAAVQPAVLMNLTGEGLAFVNPDTGSSRILPFGLDRASIQRAVAAARGPATQEGAATDCGAGALDFASYRGGLTLWLQEGRFVGWAVGSDGAADLATASGLHVGSTRAELDGAYAAEVAETSLGQEFEAGGLSGLLAATGPGGRVTALWAGATCIAR